MAGGDADVVDSQTVVDVLDGAANVLVLSATMSDDHAGGCLDLVVPDEIEQARVLAVSYTRSPDEWLEVWRDRIGSMPADVVVVTVGAGNRSTTQAAASAVTTIGDIRIRSIESPEDLTGLGIAMGEQFDEWDDDAPIVLCYDSLTVLLQFVELQRAFRFLHVLTGRVAAAGAQAHYHLDPATVDERELATLTSLFNATVRREDGTWVAHTG